MLSPDVKRRPAPKDALSLSVTPLGEKPLSKLGKIDIRSSAGANDLAQYSTSPDLCSDSKGGPYCREGIVSKGPNTINTSESPFKFDVSSLLVTKAKDSGAVAKRSVIDECTWGGPTCKSAVPAIEVSSLPVAKGAESAVAKRSVIDECTWGGPTCKSAVPAIEVSSLPVAKGAESAVAKRSVIDECTWGGPTCKAGAKTFELSGAVKKNGLQVVDVISFAKPAREASETNGKPMDSLDAANKY